MGTIASQHKRRPKVLWSLPLILLQDAPSPQEALPDFLIRRCCLEAWASGDGWGQAVLSVPVPMEQLLAPISPSFCVQAPHSLHLDRLGRGWQVGVRKLCRGRYWVVLRSALFLLEAALGKHNKQAV
jgi:hypothetical protein